MRAHIQAAALREIVSLVPLPQAEVARRSAMTPGHLADLVNARRPGSKDDVRAAIARACSVDPLAITCWCDRPDGRCRSVGGVS